MKYDTILVATDGSAPADRAVEHAMGLATQHDAVLHVISVVDTSRYGEPALSTTEIILDELEDRATELLSDIEGRADRRDVEAVTKCCHGEPHVEIVDYCEEVDADLTLLGRHGISRTGHHIGSVADRVVDNCKRPVRLA